MIDALDDVLAARIAEQLAATEHLVVESTQDLTGHRTATHARGGATDATGTVVTPSRPSAVEDVS